MPSQFKFLDVHVNEKIISPPRAKVEHQTRSMILSPRPSSNLCSFLSPSGHGTSLLHETEKGWGKRNGWSKRQVYMSLDYCCHFPLPPCRITHSASKLRKIFSRHEDSYQNATMITKNMTMGVSLLYSTFSNSALFLVYFLYSYTSTLTAQSPSKPAT